MIRVAIIMAGGSGERFWPLSRKKVPKQLLPLGKNENSILEDSINRSSTLIDKNNIFIITNELLVDTMRNSLKMLPPENIIPEPAKRNTAPCLALASAYIAARYKDIPENKISIAVLTADQNIYPLDKFTYSLDKTMEYAEKNSCIVTIGIPPSRPETGYGYIETNEPFEELNNEISFKKVLQFREKPNAEQAKDFIKTGKFTWNSGMFFWRQDVFHSEMKKHSPEIGNKIDELKEILIDKTHIVSNKLANEVKEIFTNFPSISIDYALMEKAQNIVVGKAVFQWDDIGSWDSLDRTKTKDEKGNISDGNTSLIDVNNSIFINKCKNKKVIVAGLSLNDIVVVATDDAILVCPKDKVQNVKKTVEDIREKFGEEFL